MDKYPITKKMRNLLKIRYVLIASLFLSLALLSIHKMLDLDVWFHLKAGEYIAGNLAIPRAEIFSYATPPQAYYLDSHWLFQVLLFMTHKMFGVNGIILMKASALLMVFFLLFRIDYRRSRYAVTCVFMFLCMLNLIERSLERPEIATFLFLALYLYILNAYKHKQSKLIWLLPVLQILWVNMHGLYVLGILLIGLYLAGELIVWKLRLPLGWNRQPVIKEKAYMRLAMAALLCALACFINPYGYKAVTYALALFTEIGAGANLHMKAVPELIPPFSSYGLVLERTILPYKVLIGVSIITFLLNIKKLSITNFFIYIAFFYLSLLSVRNIALFAIVSMPVMIFNVNQFIDGVLLRFRAIRFLAGVSAVIAIVFLFVFMHAVITDRYYIAQRDLKRFGWGVSDLTYPEGAVQFIKDTGIKGAVFNSADFGGYFSWACYPERKIFIDGRWEVYGEEFLVKYDRACLNKDLFDALARQYAFTYALLDNQQYLCRLLYKSKDWALVYYDEISAVFVKKDIVHNQEVIKRYGMDLALAGQANAAGMQDKLKQQPSLTSRSRSAIFHFNRANFFTNLGFYDLAENEYLQALSLKLYLCEMHNALGLLYAAKNEDERAAQHFKESIRYNRRYAPAYKNLGDRYIKLGRCDEAMIVFKRATRLQNNFPQAHAALGLAYAQGGLYAKAEKAFKQALKHDRYNLEYSYYLGDAYYLQGRFDDALAMYTKYQLHYPDINYKIGVIYFRIGDFQKAIEHLNRQIALYSFDAQTGVYLCMAYYQSRSLKEAHVVYDLLRQTAPDDVDVKKLSVLFLKKSNSK